MESFADVFVAAMKAKLPSGWHIVVRDHNAVRCSIPQNRQRAFIVGNCAAVRSVGWRSRVLSQPYMLAPMIPLTKILAPTVSYEDLEELAERQQHNLMLQLQWLSENVKSGET